MAREYTKKKGQKKGTGEKSKNRFISIL